jgi:hypothetical protein
MTTEAGLFGRGLLLFALSAVMLRKVSRAVECCDAPLVASRLSMLDVDFCCLQ